ncbi:distal membrane-arm assembly complex protein 2 isoform X1 [Lampetra fluviatilis]
MMMEARVVMRVHGWRLVCTGPGARWAHSSNPKEQWKTKIQDYYNRFSDVEFLVNSVYFLRRWRLQSQNKNFEFTKKRHGKNVAAAHFILSRGGGVRFAGQEEWYRAKKGKFSWDFLKHVDVNLEEVDASGLPINYDGFDNLEQMEQLKALYLRNCPNVDDWCLNRLHMFRESLEELHLTGCPLITDRGLASLHNLTNLKYLELSHLPLVSHKGLVKILVDEMLPNTTVIMEDAPSLNEETLHEQT